MISESVNVSIAIGIDRYSQIAITTPTVRLNTRTGGRRRRRCVLIPSGHNGERTNKSNQPINDQKVPTQNPGSPSETGKGTIGLRKWSQLDTISSRPQDSSLNEGHSVHRSKRP